MTDSYVRAPSAATSKTERPTALNTPLPRSLAPSSKRRFSARTPLAAAVVFATVGAAGVLTVAPAGAAAPSESSCTTDAGIASFAYTGGPQTFTVPAGVTSVDIAVSGASG